MGWGSGWGWGRGCAWHRTRSPPYPCPGIPPPLSGASSAQDPRGHLGTPEGLEQDCPRSGRLCLSPGRSFPPPAPPRAQQPGILRTLQARGGGRSFGRPRIMGNQNADWPPGPRRGLSLLCGLRWPSASVCGLLNFPCLLPARAENGLGEGDGGVGWGLGGRWRGGVGELGGGECLYITGPCSPALLSSPSDLGRETTD